MVGDKERLEAELVEKESEIHYLESRVYTLEDDLAAARLRISELEAELEPLARLGIAVKPV